MQTDLVLAGRRLLTSLIPLALFLTGGAWPAGSFGAENEPLVYGGLWREVYHNIQGGAVEDLRKSPRFPGEPDVKEVATSFETPLQYGENYGQRLSGYLVPPETGPYVFYLASDDQSELYLSPSARPEHKARIAAEWGWSWPRSWTGVGAGRTNTANISQPLWLQAGRPYYIEALHKEGFGGDNFGVACQLPGEPVPANGNPPMGGEHLARLAPGVTNLPPSVMISLPTNDAVFAQGQLIPLRATAFDPERYPLQVEFYSGSAFIGRGLDVLSSEMDAYVCVWSNAPLGEAVITARAMDAAGATTVSAPVRLTVVASGSVVTSTVDSGPGSLRQVLVEAPMGGTITFAVNGVIRLTSGSIEIRRPVTLRGPGAQKLTIEAANAPGTPGFRLFEIQGGSVKMEGLTLANGRLDGSDDDDGAGIENRGQLTLIGCAVVGNRALGEYSRGGAICNQWGGRLVLVGCSFLSNAAAGRNGEGGAVYNYGYLAATNCTFSGNSAGGWGGAIHNDMLSQGVWLNSCTLTKNEGSMGSGIFNRGAPPSQVSPVQLRNTIVAGNAGDDIGHCSIIRSGGYNLIGIIQQLWSSDGAGYQVGTGDRTNVTPAQVRLGALEQQGGATPYHAPLHHSLALDSGPPAGFPAVDQRGLARPFGPHCDVGAVESHMLFTNAPPAVVCPSRVQWQALTSAGATGTIEVQAEDPDGDDRTVRWTVDGAPLQTNVLSGDEFKAAITLTLLPGQHHVGVEVADGEAAPASCVIEIEVLPPLALPVKITQQPVSQSVFVGQPARFSVEAAGTPPLEYQWLFNGQKLEGRTLQTLTITNALPRHQGNYAVRVSNAISQVHSSTAELTILTEPAGHWVDLSFHPAFEGDDYEPVREVVGGRDGKVLVAGTFDRVNGQELNSVVRLQTDGAFDPAFRFGLTHFSPRKLAVYPDGRILVGGSGTGISGEHVELVRLYPNGGVDPAFRFVMSPTQIGPVTALALQRDGRILVNFVPCCGPDGNGSNVVLRLRPDGSRDPMFHPFATHQLDDDLVKTIAVQTNGQILVGGYLLAEDQRTPQHLIRLKTDGTVDTSFWPKINSMVNTVVIQPDGKILIGGWFTEANGTACSGLARLHPDGSLDTGFNSVLWPNHRLDVRCLTLAADGSILLGGTSYNAYEWSSVHFVTRVNAQGVWDEEHLAIFADTPLKAERLGVSTMAIGAGGHLVVGGSFGSVNGVPRANLVRLLNDFDKEPSFVTRQIHQQTITLEARPGGLVKVYAAEDRPPEGWQILNISHHGVFDTVMRKVKFGPFFDNQPRYLTYVALPPLGFVGVGRFVGMASADGSNSPILGDDRIMVAPPHPAEQTPADWGLRMEEVTAYAVAWRSGKEWPVPPNPIPIEYVTRAVRLWRGGELYTVDAQADGPPLWWVNVTPNSQIQPLFSEDSISSTATRVLPASYVRDESIEVTVAVAPAPETRGYAIEETLPAGSLISGISHSGQLDEAHHQVKWGPFFDAVPRRLTYRVQLPAAQSAWALAGRASFDGSSLTVGGDQMVRTGSRLSWKPRSGDGRWTLRLHSEPGTKCVLEVSTNLKEWTPLMTLTNTLGEVEVPVETTGSAGAVYYRTRVIQ